MGQTKKAPTSTRRWELSKEEQKRSDQVYEGSLSARRLARLVVRNPRLAVDVLRAMVEGAIDGVATSGSVFWAIDAERVREAVPDAASGATWSGQNTFLEALMRHATPGMRVLDLGCGAGRFAQHIAPIVREVVCVDSCGTLLREARIQLKEHDNVTYVQNRRWMLPGIQEGSVDLVFSQGVFGYVGPREFVALAAETRRILRPGGVFLFSAYTIEDEHARREVREDTERGRVHGGIREPYTRDYLIALLDFAGLEPPDPLEITVHPGGYLIFASRRAHHPNSTV